MTNEIKTRIKKMREILGVPQSQLAQVANITTQYVSQLEKGTNKNPDEAILRKIAEFFSSTLPWMRDGLGWSFIPSDSLQALNFAYRSIDLKPDQIGILSDYNEETMMIGMPKGFIFTWNDFSVSMAGTRTRAGYRGAGPSNYRDILIKIYNSGIKKIGFMDFTLRKDEVNLDLIKINQENLKIKALPSKHIIEDEFENLHDLEEKEQNPLFQKIKEARARVAAAKKRLQAAQLRVSAAAYRRRATTPAHPEQEGLYLNKAAVVEAKAAKLEVEADLLEVQA